MSFYDVMIYIIAAVLVVQLVGYVLEATWDRFITDPIQKQAFLPMINKVISIARATGEDRGQWTVWVAVVWAWVWHGYWWLMLIAIAASIAKVFAKKARVARAAVNNSAQPATQDTTSTPMP